MPKVTSLGHIGLFVSDYDKMRDFYTRILGFTVTDEARERGMCFLSAHPDDEHHEVLLASGRQALYGSPQIQQMSFHVDSIKALREFRVSFIDEGVTITSEVTHGNAASIYFDDPEAGLTWDKGGCPSGANCRTGIETAALSAQRGRQYGIDFIVRFGNRAY